MVWWSGQRARALRRSRCVHQANIRKCTAWEWRDLYGVCVCVSQVLMYAHCVYVHCGCACLSEADSLTANRLWMLITPSNPPLRPALLTAGISDGILQRWCVCVCVCLMERDTSAAWRKGIEKENSRKSKLSHVVHLNCLYRGVLESCYISHTTGSYSTCINGLHHTLVACSL